MAKLADINSGAHKAGGISFRALYPCKVNSKGDFFARIKTEDLTQFTSIVEAHSGVTIIRDKSGEYDLTAKTLAELQRVCDEFARWQIEVDRKEEIRIYYKIKTSADFWLTDNNQVTPNGEGETTGAWSKDCKVEMAFGSGAPFSVGLGATIRKHVVMTPRTGKPAIVLEFVDKENLGVEGQRLMRFRDQPRPAVLGDRIELASIPYTEEAAKFFADHLQRICEEADVFARFFKQGEEQIAADIEADMAPTSRRLQAGI